MGCNLLFYIAIFPQSWYMFSCSVKLLRESKQFGTFFLPSKIMQRFPPPPKQSRSEQHTYQIFLGSVEAYRNWGWGRFRESCSMRSKGPTCYIPGIYGMCNHTSLYIFCSLEQRSPTFTAWWPGGGEGNWPACWPVACISFAARMRVSTSPPLAWLRSEQAKAWQWAVARGPLVQNDTSHGHNLCDNFSNISLILLLGPNLPKFLNFIGITLFELGSLINLVNK